MKKLFTLLTLLLCVASSAWAATVGDLVAISSDWTFIADDITSNGTTKLTANTLYCNGKIFAPTANSVATNKGNSTIGGVSHLNSLRLKNTQDQLCFKVSGACTVTFYTQSNSSRGIQAGTTAGGTDLGTQSVSTTEWVLDLSKLKAETTVYLSSFGGDFYFAGFVVTFPGKSYAMQVGVDDASHGTATVSSESVKEGASVTFRAFEKVGWKFKNWTKTGSDPIEIVSTANPYVIEAVTGAISLTANFEETTTHTVTISAGETGALGNYYDNTVVTQNEGTTVTLPIKNSYFYKEGYTATGWTDGTNDYEFGEVITLNKDYAIYPKFELNGAALGDEVTTVTWDLSRSVADKLHIEFTKGYVVTTAQVGTATIDVPSYWDNSAAGKLDNRSRSDSYSQVNGGSKFTIPAIKGMTVTLTASNQISATLDGEEMTATASSPYTATYTYEGDANEVEIIISGGSYFSTIVAEYPYTGIPGPADPTPVAGPNVTWDFSSADKQEAAGTITAGQSNTLTATDGASEITYVAGSNDKYETSNNNYYLKPGGGSGKSNSGIYTNRYFILNITKSGTISFVGANTSTKSGDYVILQGSTEVVADAVEKGTVANTASNCSYSVNVQDGEYVFVAFSSQIYTASLSWADNSENIALTTTSTMKGWRAFYNASSDYGYTLDANTKAYVATNVEAQGESDVVVLNEIDAVPAETAVLLKTTNETQEGYSMTLTKASNVPTPDIINKLKRAGAATNTQVYRLGANDDGVGFFAYTKEAAKPDVVVLDVDSSSAGARSLTIAFADDETTGIGLIDNGKLTIDNEAGAWYSIQGVRHDGKPSRSGLYIFNGKKVVIK